MQFKALLSPILLLTTLFLGHNASADTATTCTLAIIRADGAALETPELLSQGSLGLVFNNRISFEALREPNTLKKQTVLLELHQASLIEVSLHRRGLPTLNDTINLQTPKVIHIEARESSTSPLLLLQLTCR